MNVLAHLLGSSGDELPGSPVVMPHLEYGCYTNDSFLMPYDPEVTAVYKVYVDPAHTTISPDHSDAIDVFPLEADSCSSSVDLTGSVDDSTISGTIDESTDLGGSIFNDSLGAGTIESDVNLTGTLDESEVSSQVEEGDETTGSVNC